MENYIITIARGLGSGGSHIGKILAKELGIHYYDNEILQMAADISGINESYFYDANEKIMVGALAVKNSTGVYNKRTLYHEGDKEFFSNENLFNFEAEVMKNMAIEGKDSCIIIGKAANYILRGLKNVVKINIQAPEDKCVYNLVKRECINAAEAKKKIAKTDKYRADYYKYYTGENWISPKEYDLCINTGSVSEEYAAKMIIDLLKQRELINQ